MPSHAGDSRVKPSSELKFESSSLASVLGAMVSAEQLIPIACPSTLGEGRYQLDELIALGPRSWVYRGTDLLLSSPGYDEIVAVKVFRTEGSELRECSLSKSVNDSNVVRILDRGQTEQGFGYIVTEFIPAGDLAHHVAPWSPEKAVTFVESLARTVQAAHNSGVVHCDIKPRNILVGRDGLPKLADFELSVLDGTDDGRVRGTRGFMSPEQASGEALALTPLSDIYAVGGILFYLLTGGIPNEHSPDERIKLLQSKLQAARCPRRDDLLAICVGALAPVRGERYQSAEALAEELRRWGDYLPVLRANRSGLYRTVLAARRRPAVAVGIIALFLMTMLATATGVWWRTESARRETVIQAEANRISNEDIEKTRAILRRNVADMYRVVSSGTGSEADAVLPTLVWLDWISNRPLFQPEGVQPPTERLSTLRNLRDNGTQLDGTVESLLLTYSIGQMELAIGHPAASKAEFDHLLDKWSNRLFADDALLLKCRVLQACAEAELTHGEACRKARQRARDAWKAGRVNRSESFNQLVISSLQRSATRAKMSDAANPE